MMLAHGERISAQELVKILDATGVRASKPDLSLSDVQENVDVHGWRIRHAEYRPHLPFFLKGAPGLVFVLQDPAVPRVTEHMEVSYGPETRAFLLERKPSIYYGHDVPYWEGRGTSRSELEGKFHNSLG